MRDPRRIRTILYTLGEYWHKTPDLRLGQLILGAVSPSTACPELFYIEDEDLLAKLQAQVHWTAVQPAIDHMNYDIRTFLDTGISHIGISPPRGI